MVEERQDQDREKAEREVREERAETQVKEPEKLEQSVH